MRSSAAIATAFTLALAAGVAAVRDALPERFSAGDRFVLGVATHRHSRLVA